MGKIHEGANNAIQTNYVGNNGTYSDPNSAAIDGVMQKVKAIWSIDPLLLGTTGMSL